MTKKNDQSVLGNLPSTRPARIGRRREGASARAEAPAAKPATATKAKPAAKRKPAAATAAKAKAAAKPRAAEPKPRPVTPRAPTPKKSTGPRAVRSGAPALDREPRPSASVPPPPQSVPPKGTGVVTTAVQAAGELAQIGITLGGQVAKRALKRIPKP